MLGVKAGLVGEQPRQVKFTVARARHRRQAGQGPARRGARAASSAGHHARGSAWSAASTPTTTATDVKRPRRAVLAAHRRARPALLRGDARDRRPGRADRARPRTARAIRPRPRPASGSRSRASSWFAQDNDDRIDVLPEKKRYEPGETARLQVRMPFREATALVSGRARGRDRDARGDAARRRSDGRAEGRADLGAERLRQRAGAARPRSARRRGTRSSPGAGGSRSRGGRASATTARTTSAPTALVDLAKPAFKLGVAELQVGMAAHELQVQRRRRQAAVPRAREGDGEDRASARDGKPLRRRARSRSRRSTKACSSCATTRSWNLLDAMMQRARLGRRDRAPRRARSSAGATTAARPLPRAAAAAAARRASSSTRCSSGRRHVVARRQRRGDRRGAAQRFADRASASSPSPTPACSSSAPAAPAIRVTQDLQVLAGSAAAGARGRPLRADADAAQHDRARDEGARRRCRDGQPAGAERRRDRAPADRGAAGAGRGRRRRPGEGDRLARRRCRPTRSASPGKRRPRTATRREGPDQGDAARRRGGAGARAAGDARAARRRVRAAGRRAGRRAARDRRQARRLDVAVQPRLTGALPGMRRFFETYPFICLEQKTSKAVGLSDAALWAAVANALPTYLDSDGLASYFPPRAGDPPRGSDRLTAYLIAATHEAGFELPPAARDAMLDGLTAFVEGRIERRFWSPRADLDVRKLAAHRGAVAPRPGAAEDARLDQHRAEHLADGGGDRLAQHPAPRRRHPGSRAIASTKRSRSCARA